MLGIDIVQLSRIQLDAPFMDYVLTEEEKEIYSRKQDNHLKREYLAGRFAAKEAIFKATQDKGYLNYSVLNDSNGKPYVKDHPEIHISISHDGDYAVAIADGIVQWLRTQE